MFIGLLIGLMLSLLLLVRILKQKLVFSFDVF